MKSTFHMKIRTHSFKLTFVLTFLIILLLSKSIYSQENPNPFPASPSAAELGKYGSWPVDYHHGIPQISIPLYKLVVGDLSLPISLSYHASGIKVDQEASWVGLGWSLNAGGVITRQINGNSDFIQNYIYVKTFEEVDAGVLPTWQQVEDAATKDPYTGLSMADSEPDLFNFNFAGYSGQFVIKRLAGPSYNAHILNETKGLKIIDVAYDPSTSSVSFAFVNQNGTKYFFEHQEQTKRGRFEHVFNYNSDVSIVNNLYINVIGIFLNYGTSRPSSWFLSRIESSNGNNYIDFHYTPKTILNLSGYSGSIFYDEEQPIVGWSSTPITAYPSGGSPGMILQGGNVVYSLNLESISTSNGTTIEFVAETLRTDIIEDFTYFTSSNNNELDTIKISYNGEPIKQWDFGYEYFGSCVNTQDAGIENSDGLNYRLKLKSITQKSPDGLDSFNPYVFSYFGETEDDPKMPFKQSCAGRDNYGYCNSNVTIEEAIYPLNLFPNIESKSEGMANKIQGYYQPGSCVDPFPGSCSYPCLILDYHFNDRQYSFIEGSERNPNLEYAKLYTLKQISYPTGGSTIFHYELNGYTKTAKAGTYGDGEEKYGGGLRLQKTETIEPNSANPIIKEYTYNNLDGNNTGIVDFEQRWGQPKSNRCEVISGNGCIWNFNTVLNTQPVINSGPVYYSDVTESTIGEGSTIYTFITQYTEPSNCPKIEYESRFFGMSTGCGTTFQPITFIDYLHPYYTGFQKKSFFTGMLKSKKIYDENDRLIQMLVNTYDFINGNYVYGMEALMIGDIGNTRANIYRIPTGKSFLESTTTTNFYYTDNGESTEVSNSSNFVYDFNNELLKQETKSLNNGNQLKTKYYYPTTIENPDDVFMSQIMLDILGGSKYMTGKVLKMEKLLNDNPIEGIISSYGFYNNTSLNIFPSIIRKLEGSNYVPKLYFDDYDIYGNVVQYHSENGINTSFRYGYNQNYPIVQAVNSTPDEFRYTGFENNELFEWTAYDQPVITLSNDTYTGNYINIVLSDGSNIFGAGTQVDKVYLRSNTGYKASVWAKGPTTGKIKIQIYDETGPMMVKEANIIESNSGWQLLEVEFTQQEIENYFAQINYLLVSLINTSTSEFVYFDDVKFYPSDIQLSTYTFDPLVGITSETTAANTSSFYSYDEFGRLSNIKDHNKNIIEKYDYHYTTNQYPHIIISPNNYSFEYDGGVVTFDVESNVNWSVFVENEVDWITVITGSNYFDVSCFPQDLYEIRTASIRVEDDNDLVPNAYLNISQLPIPIFETDVPELVWAYDDIWLEKAINLTSNLPWNLSLAYANPASENMFFLTTATSGSGDTQIKITNKNKNTTGTTYLGTLTISSPWTTDIIEIPLTHFTN